MRTRSRIQAALGLFGVAVALTLAATCALAQATAAPPAHDSANLFSPQVGKLVETGGATLVFMCVFLFGGHIYPARRLSVSERSTLSVFAGVSIAYVFVHLMPELAGARDTFVKWTSLPTIFEGRAVYLIAMIGFLAFYGLDHFSKQARLALTAGQIPDFDIKVIGFAGYVCLVSYLLVDNLENSPLAEAGYALAMALHFFTFDHAFREEVGGGYKRRGHLLLAAAAAVGWGLGLAFHLPRDVLALMLGFLSGGVIVNSAIGELPSEKHGKLWPFVAGGLLYGSLLITLG